VRSMTSQLNAHLAAATARALALEARRTKQR
jgi:hypothetical protein